LKKLGQDFEEKKDFEEMDYDKVDDYLKYLKSLCKKHPAPVKTQLESDLMNLQKQ